MDKRNYNYSTTVMLPRSIWPYWHWHEPEEIFWWHSKDLQPKYSFAWTAISLEQSSGLHASCHLDVNRQSHVTNCHTGVEEVCHSNEVCCCEDQEAEAWIKVSSLWDSKGPRWGEDRSEERIHKTRNIRSSHTRLIVLLLLLCVIWGRLFVDWLDSAYN